MGQRLPSLPMDWANLVAQGDSKRHEGAAAIRAQGTDAMMRGIQQGVAGITAGVLRKKETKREDARWEAQMAFQKEKEQFDRDRAVSGDIIRQLREMRTQAEEEGAGMVGPDGMPVNAEADARYKESGAQLLGHLDFITKRAGASPLAQIQQAPAQGAGVPPMPMPPPLPEDVGNPVFDVNARGKAGAAPAGPKPVSRDGFTFSPPEQEPLGAALNAAQVYIMRADLIKSRLGTVQTGLDAALAKLNKPHKAREHGWLEADHRRLLDEQAKLHSEYVTAANLAANAKEGETAKAEAAKGEAAATTNFTQMLGQFEALRGEGIELSEAEMAGYMAAAKVGEDATQIADTIRDRRKGAAKSVEEKQKAAEEATAKTTEAVKTQAFTKDYAKRRGVEYVEGMESKHVDSLATDARVREFHKDTLARQERLDALRERANNSPTKDNKMALMSALRAELNARTDAATGFLFAEGEEFTKTAFGRQNRQALEEVSAEIEKLRKELTAEGR